MLKKVPNFVLGSTKSSTYRKGYASGFVSPAALLDDLFEHPPYSLLRKPASNIKVLFNTDIALSCVAENRHHIFPSPNFLRDLLGGKDVGA
jgi:hypothetical protein